MLSTSGMMPTNFVGDHLVEVVTFNLVAAISSCVILAVGITVWVIFTFQTKKDARDQEGRLQDEHHDLQERIDEQVKQTKEDIQSVHNHMHNMRDEIKGEQNQLRAELTQIRTDLGRTATDVSYIRGRLEPKP